MTNLLFFTHVRCWLPRQMMLVRNNDVLLIVLAWGGGGDIFVRCGLQTDWIFFGTDVCVL